MAEFSRLVTGEEVEKLERAVSLYPGEFLEGFSVSEAAPFEDWARLKAEQLQRSYVAGMHRLVAALQSSGELAGALGYAWRLVEAEPLDESGHRQVMRLLALNGQRAEALAQYEACRKVLKSELKATPSAETEELHELLLKGEMPPIMEETPRPVRLAQEGGSLPVPGISGVPRAGCAILLWKGDIHPAAGKSHPEPITDRSDRGLVGLGEIFGGVRRAAAAAAGVRSVADRQLPPGRAPIPGAGRRIAAHAGAGEQRNRPLDPGRQAGKCTVPR